MKKENKAHQETWALQDPRVYKVTRALLQSQEDQDLLGPLDELGTWEYLADQAQRVTPAFKGSKEAKGRRVRKVSKDLKARLGMRGCQVNWETEENEAPLESWVEKAV